MKIYEFTLPELNYFREYCNFTPDELTLFNYRAAHYPLEQCAELMNVSVATVKRISGRVNKKVKRVSKGVSE